MLTRRHFIAASALGVLAGRSAAQEGGSPAGLPPARAGALQLDVAPQPLDAALQLPPDTDGGFAIPERFRARVVPVQPGLVPSSIHIVPQSYNLYFILPGDQAIRYGVAIGQEGLGWRGQATIGRKAEWPSWTPTPEMIERSPEQYEQYADGMPGGPNNPLGARALYFYQGDRDTAIRVHGTIQPASIGSRASNGCFRMYNSHVIDLYNRVPLGALAYAY
jgi:lipoprotein-anchoring transpeptidase ErfK/SrfK